MGGVERLNEFNTSRWTSPFNGQEGSWGMASGMGMGSEIEEMHIRHAIMAIGLFVVVALMGAGALVAAALYGRRNALRELSQYKSLSHGGGSSSHVHHLSSGSLGEMHRSKHHTVREYAEQVSACFAHSHLPVSLAPSSSGARECSSALQCPARFQRARSWHEWAAWKQGCPLRVFMTGSIPFCGWCLF